MFLTSVYLYVADKLYILDVTATSVSYLTSCCYVPTVYYILYNASVELLFTMIAIL